MANNPGQLLFAFMSETDDEPHMASARHHAGKALVKTAASRIAQLNDELELAHRLALEATTHTAQALHATNLARKASRYHYLVKSYYGKDTST